MKKLIFFIPLLVSTVLLGCHKGQPKQAESSKANQMNYNANKPLLPLAKGNQWQYSAYKTIQSPQNANTYKSTYLFEVTNLTQTSNGEQQATIDVTSNGKLVERKIWTVGKNGIYQAAGGEKGALFTPPMPIVPFPIQNHGEFTWNGTGPMELGANTASSLTGRFLGTEDFDTDAGRFKGITVESHQDWTQNNKPATALSQSWWIPGVGLGRLIEVTALPNVRLEIILRLKSYKLSPK